MEGGAGRGGLGHNQVNWGGLSFNKFGFGSLLGHERYWYGFF